MSIDQSFPDSAPMLFGSCDDPDRVPHTHRSSLRTLYAISALLFVSSATATVLWCRSMSAGGGMSMPGGWTMSMAWMRMPGQSWTRAAVSFLGMWDVMMVAMMLPSLVPMLSRYQQLIGSDGAPDVGRRTVVAGAGYFFTWTVLGAVLFPLGAALASLTMQHPALSRAIPWMAATVLVLAGALQFTAWKTGTLACCQAPASGDRNLTPLDLTSWQHGLRLGLHCIESSAGPTAILLVLGVMDLEIMAIVSAAITFERLTPLGGRSARLIGTIAIGVGLVLAGSAAGLR